jgi:hypothetical protein
MDRILDHCFGDERPDPVMNHHNVCILWKDIHSIFYRLLPSLSTRDDLGDLLKFIFFDNLFQTVIHIFLANHQEDGADERTGLEFIEGVSEDGFSPQEVELFLLPFHEAMALSSGDDHCVGLHRSIEATWGIGMMEQWKTG